MLALDRMLRRVEPLCRKAFLLAIHFISGLRVLLFQWLQVFYAVDSVLLRIGSSLIHCVLLLLLQRCRSIYEWLTKVGTG